MKYHRLLEKLNRDRKLRMMITAPLLGFMFIGVFIHTFFTGEIWYPGIFGLVIIIAVFVILITSNTGYDKQIAKMRLAVGAGSEAEFAQMIEQAEVYEELYFLTDRYFLNFLNLRAYPYDEITGLRCYEEHDSETGSISDYRISLIHSGGQSDWVSCNRMAVRDALYQALMQRRGR